MKIELSIKPYWDDAEQTVNGLDLAMTTDAPVTAGKRSLAWIRDIVRIPFCPMDGLVLSDDAGELPFTVEDGDAEMSFIYRSFIIPQRDAVGDVHVSWHVTPRVQPEGYRSSPYFDLVAEKGGVQGSGTTFLLHPADIDGEADVSISWDLSALPEGCHGVWTFGNGDASRHMSLQDLLFSVFMTGKVNCAEDGHAGFYWFDELPFSAEEASEQINQMFDYMAKMFHDKGDCYRVFTRHNHFPGGGGTAFARSYIYGYGADEKVELEELRDLLAHEMTHNWPTMVDEPAGLGTWYLEGSAEYYSTIVPMEMGLCSLEHTAKVINSKAGSYFRNPCHDLSNLELGKIYWEDRRCQRVPYSRGVLFLSNVDARIRRATNGEKTLLDAELALLEMEKATAMPQDFLDAVRKISGIDLADDYEQMCAGGVPDCLVPDPDAFGGHFEARPVRVQANNASHSDEFIPGDEWFDGYEWVVKA